MHFQRSKSTVDSLKRVFNVFRRKPLLGAPDFAIQPWKRIVKTSCPAHWIVIYLARVVQMLDSAIHQAPVVQTLDSAIHRIKVYPVDNAIGFPSTYPLDSDLSSG